MVIGDLLYLCTVDHMRVGQERVTGSSNHKDLEEVLATNRLLHHHSSSTMLRGEMSTVNEAVILETAEAKGEAHLPVAGEEGKTRIGIKVGIMTGRGRGIERGIGITVRGHPIDGPAVIGTILLQSALALMIEKKMRSPNLEKQRESE